MRELLALLAALAVAVGLPAQPPEAALAALAARRSAAASSQLARRCRNPAARRWWPSKDVEASFSCARDLS